MNNSKVLKVCGVIIIMVICLLCALTSVYAGTKDPIVLNKTNTVLLIGEVDSSSVSSVISQILATKQTEVFLYIRSPGGSVIDGAQLVNFISHSDKKINCIVDFAASMAFAITQSCNTRYILETGVLMQHMASYGLENQPAPNAHSFILLIEELIRSTVKLQADRLGMSVDAFYAKSRDDWWLFGQQAVDQHVVDSSAFIKCTQDLLDSEIKLTVMTMFGLIDVTYNGCPLITSPKKVGFAKGMTEPQQSEFVKNLDYKAKHKK